jgi:tRNA (mo5U34)-methyltransferase
VRIDTEWRSDLKWSRLCEHIDLTDKLVLDVGCGNGYYLYRMLGAGATAAVGVDPFLLYVMQFQAVNQYAQENRAAVLPLGVEGVPVDCACFDTVFSMGILYHRREPKEHLSQLCGFVKPGGQVVLETIVLDAAGEALLEPKGRYGKMRNVGAIPSVELLKVWLAESGFGNVQVLDVTKTTSCEQRKTEWMTFESLGDFLDPADESKTIDAEATG